MLEGEWEREAQLSGIGGDVQVDEIRAEEDNIRVKEIKSFRLWTLTIRT